MTQFWPKVGDKVRCLNAENSPGKEGASLDGLTRDAVYTVRKITTCRATHAGEIGLELVEITRARGHCFWIGRFRPE